MATGPQSFLTCAQQQQYLRHLSYVSWHHHFPFCAPSPLALCLHILRSVCFLKQRFFKSNCFRSTEFSTYVVAHFAAHESTPLFLFMFQTWQCSNNILAFVASTYFSVLTNKLDVFVKNHICSAEPTLEAGHERLSIIALIDIALMLWFYRKSTVATSTSRYKPTKTAFKDGDSGCWS